MPAVLLLAGLTATVPAHAKWLPVDLVLDVKSKFSDGCLSVQNLAELAQHRGIEGLVVSDHDRVSFEYGLPPLERIFKKKEEGPSILDSSASTYLSEIRQVDTDFPNVLLIPGVESAPYYFWSGSPFDDSLVAHNWDKHLLILGLQTAEEIEQLPTLNSNLSWHYFDQFKGRFLVIAAVFVLSVVFFYQKKSPKLALTTALMSLLLAVNYHPLRSSPYDPYHGDAGPGPYQETINYVNERGGLVFWNHLESPTANGSRTTGGMQLETPPHPEDLLNTVNYSGFQVLDDAPVPAADPGQLWDRLLEEYQNGDRRHPVWGFAANDFHCEDQDGHKFGGLRTVVLVSQKETAAVLEAMRKGRMYAVRQIDETRRLALDEFTVADGMSGLEATLGESLAASDFPEIRMALRSVKGKESSARLQVIRNGTVVKEETVSLPYRGAWRDLTISRMRPVNYRLVAEEEGGGRLVSNPVFVRFQKGGADQVARLPKASSPPPVMPMPEVTEPAPAASPRTPPAPKAAAPRASMPAPVAAPSAPHIELPTAPTVAEPSMTPVGSAGFVKSRIQGLALRSGPGVSFPEIMQAEKGESLEKIRQTSVVLNGKPWLVVRKQGRQVYVWSGFLSEP